MTDNFVNNVTHDLMTDSMVKKRNHTKNYNEPILWLTAIATNAANPHNTQSWVIKKLGKYEMNLYIDENRTIPETDPLGRQLHIGAGAFLEIFCIAANKFGFDTEITLFPEGVYELPYTKENLQGQNKPLFSIRITEGTSTIPKNDILFKEIFRRQTSRGVYHGKILESNIIEQCIGLTGNHRRYIGYINDEASMKPLLELFDKAMEIECNTYKTYDETRRWFRVSEKERALNRDGLSLPQTGSGKLMTLFLETFFNIKSEKMWFDKASIDTYLKGFRKGLYSSKGIIIISTESNEIEELIHAGRAFISLALALSSKGIFVHPYTQILQEYQEMSDLKNKFYEKISGIKSNVNINNCIQMVARIGKSKEPYYSYRRNLDDLII